MFKKSSFLAKHIFRTAPILLALGVSAGTAYGDAQIPAPDVSASLNLTVGIDAFENIPLNEAEIPDSFDFNRAIRENMNLGIAVFDPETGGFALTPDFLKLRDLNATLRDSIRASVVVSSTPVPPAIWLLASGLIGLAGWVRRSR